MKRNRNRGRGREGGVKKRKNMFMKSDMPRDIDPIGGRIKTPIARMIETITQKNTGQTLGVKFGWTIRLQTRKTLITKNFKRRIIGFGVKEKFKGRNDGRLKR